MLSLGRRAWIALFLIVLFFLVPAVFAQIECVDGEKKECVTVQQCDGIQKCADGQWSECLLEKTACEYGAKTACIPKVNGVACEKITGVRQCGICGQWLEECAPYSGRVECCPGQQRVCDVTSSQECSEYGRWNTCFGGQSCKNVKCDDGDSCTENKCAMGKCIFSKIEKCCHSDQNCNSSDRCTGGTCVAIDCGECFEAQQWQCVPRKRGICCKDHWNEGFSSCSFDYSATRERIESVEDERTAYFFAKGEKAVKEGRLKLAQYYFQAAELSADLAGRAEDYNADILSALNLQFDAIEKALGDNNFSSMRPVYTEIGRLFRKVKPAGQAGSADGNQSVAPTPEPEPAPEIPWLFIIPLMIMLVFMVLLLLSELRKKGQLSVLPQAEKKKEEPEIEAEAPQKEKETENDGTFSDLFG
ncbi:MAG: hypothetical protein NT067_02045 [Candidatus Diapherotrites archaeon]|nr:hypothetical protein [Candidatus Diapherotrites archaeon]